MRKLLLMSLVAITQTLSAQTTRIVGVGGTYQSIQAAINASTDGDLILVRSNASLFTVDNKALTILVDPGVVFTLLQGTCRVMNLAAGKRVVLSGLAFRENRTVLAVVNCTGRVVLDSISLPLQTLTPTYPTGSIQIQSCRDVLIQNSSITPGLDCFSSTIRVVNTSLVGVDAARVASIPNTATVGCRVSSCNIEFASCQVTGGNGTATLAHAPALVSSSSSIRVREGTALTSRVDAAVGDASSIFEFASGAIMTGPITGFGRTTGPLFLPSLDIGPIRRGANYYVRTRGAPGDFAAVFVSAPGMPRPIPGFGTLWLDPVTIVHIGSLALNTTGIGTIMVLASPNPIYQGLQLDFQAVTGRAKIAQLTNVAAALYR